MFLLLLLLSCSPDATWTCKFATSCLFFKLHHTNFVKHCVERLFLPFCVGMKAHGLVKHVLLALVALLLVPHGGIVEGKKREKNSKRVPSKTYSSTGTSTVNGGSIKRNGVPPPPPPPPPPSGIARNRRRVKSSSSRTTSGTDGRNSNAIERSLKITPTFVQFEESPACIPVVQTVILEHQDADSLVVN